MTVCNGCGSCCHPVVLPFTKAEAAASDIPADIKWWVAEILTPMSPKEAKRLEPHLFARPHLSLDIDRMTPFFYRCGWFDEEERVCTNYEGRPEGCRTFPWKTGRPKPGANLPPSCSFNADIGQPVVLGPTRKGPAPGARTEGTGSTGTGPG